MTKQHFPDDILSQHVAVLGKSSAPAPLMHWPPADLGAEEEIQRLHKKNSELNRRCQKADAAVADAKRCIDEMCRNQTETGTPWCGGSLGRALLASLCARQEEEIVALRAELAERLDHTASAWRKLGDESRILFRGEWAVAVGIIWPHGVSCGQIDVFHCGENVYGHSIDREIKAFSDEHLRVAEEVLAELMEKAKPGEQLNDDQS